MTHAFPTRRSSERADFRSLHGPSASSMAFRVADPKAAYDHAIKEGATPVDAGRGILGDDACAIEGIGGSYLYLVQAGAALSADWPAGIGRAARRGQGCPYV